MTSDSDDKNLKEFLKSHRPAAPKPSLHEADLIWEKVSQVKGFFFWREALAFGIFVVALTSYFYLNFKPQEDLASVIMVEESLTLELEEEEMIEVRNLIALAEKGQE